MTFTLLSAIYINYAIQAINRITHRDELHPSFLQRKQFTHNNGMQFLRRCIFLLLFPLFTNKSRPLNNSRYVQQFNQIINHGVKRILLHDHIVAVAVVVSTRGWPWHLVCVQKGRSLWARGK